MEKLRKIHLIDGMIDEYIANAELEMHRKVSSFFSGDLGAKIGCYSVNKTPQLYLFHNDISE